MLTSDVARLECRVPQDFLKDPNAAKSEKHRGVYWLPCVRDGTHGRSRIPGQIAVEAPPISVPDPDATPMAVGKE